MVWGRARNLNGVHWFDANGDSLCTESHGRHMKLKYPRPDWPIDHPATCERCKILRSDEILIEEKSHA